MAPATMDCAELQKEIIEKITNNEVSELKTLLAVSKIKIDFSDKNGMTPLQHACYKGNKEIVQMLLDQGADVNVCHHENGYTALHLAALSGNAELCYLLSTHGAKINARNSVGRTAAQMAAFVGNHNCVAIINNYIPKADIDYYVKPQGLQTEPMLPPHIADSFHKFIMQVNVHPVRVAINLQRYTGLLDHLPKIQKVLESLCHREMARAAETNEIMALKYHYLSGIVNEVIKLQKRQEARKEKIEREKTETLKSEISAESQNDEKTLDNSEEKKMQTDLVELFIKQLLKCGKNDSSKMEYQEVLLREIVREFPFRQSTIFRQMVATFASSDPPSAVSVVSAAINGQRGFSDTAQICVTCGEEKAMKKCSKCKAVQYCDRECQRYHWFLHKKECTRQATNLVAKTQLSSLITEEIDNLGIN